MDSLDDYNQREKRQLRNRSKTPIRKTNNDVLGEEHEWEDVMDGGSQELGADPLEASVRMSITPPLSPRKRRAGARTTYVASNRPTRRNAVPSQPKLALPRRASAQSITPEETYTVAQPLIAREEVHSAANNLYVNKEVHQAIQPIASKEEIQAALNTGVRSTLVYLHEIASWFFYILKAPLPFILALWALAIILNSLSVTMRSAISPLCNLPVLSRINVCKHINSVGEWGGRPLHAEYPNMVEIQSKTFEQLLDESVGGSSLALEIKKAEMATADLVTVVRTSNLRSKEHLASTLGGFITNARDTSRGLQKLNAKVSGSVDSILAISDYALQTIEAVESKQASSIMKYVWPFEMNTDSELLASTFAQSLSVLSSSLESLILSAETSLRNLDELEAQLGVIHEILVREDATLSVEHSELLADLWTRLGGNRARKQRFEGNFNVLRELGSYRSRALAHVVAALQALQTLSAEMEELRERAAAPELSGNEIPMEVHARAIRSGVQRLNEERLRAKEKEEEAVRRILGLESGDS